MITTLIIGKKSNLSRQLDSKISNATLVSAKAIRDDLDLLSKCKKQKINIRNPRV